MRRLRPDALFDSFFGLLDIKLGKCRLPLESTNTLVVGGQRLIDRIRDHPLVWRKSELELDSRVLSSGLRSLQPRDHPDTQLINKVAGLYGLITIFVGGSFLQLAFYAYSTASLFAFFWALRIVKSVSRI